MCFFEMLKTKNEEKICTAKSKKKSAAVLLQILLF